jgi:hypothetical protein
MTNREDNFKKWYVDNLPQDQKAMIKQLENIGKNSNKICNNVNNYRAYYNYLLQRLHHSFRMYASKKYRQIGLSKYTSKQKGTTYIVKIILDIYFSGEIAP